MCEMGSETKTLYINWQRSLVHSPIFSSDPFLYYCAVICSRQSHAHPCQFITISISGKWLLSWFLLPSFDVRNKAQVPPSYGNQKSFIYEKDVHTMIFGILLFRESADCTTDISLECLNINLFVLLSNAILRELLKCLLKQTLGIREFIVYLRDNSQRNFHISKMRIVCTHSTYRIPHTA